MKKIIAALDGLKFSKSTEQYAIETACTNGAHLTGVFLDDYTYTAYKMSDLISKDNASERELRQYSQRDYETRHKAAADFENVCQKAQVSYNIHHDRNIAVRELLHESIYADLLVLNSGETLSIDDEKMPACFIRNILSDVQCPVLLVPRQYKKIEKVVFLYNRDSSSVHAIKMFSYVMASLRELPMEVLSVNGTHGDLHVPDNRLMKEFMKEHCPNTKFTVLNGNTELEIVKQLKTEKLNVLIVLGAYGRSTVSRLLSKSMADLMLQQFKFPLFIAHCK